MWWISEARVAGEGNVPGDPFIKTGRFRFREPWERKNWLLRRLGETPCTENWVFNFAPDTAHLYWGGSDVVKMFEKHKHRLVFMDYKVGETRPGRTAITLERNTTTLVFKAVPAEVCANCGEPYVAEEISRQIPAAADLAARSGVQVDVRDFVGVVT